MDPREVRDIEDRQAQFPLSLSGSSKEQKSHRVTLRYETTSTKRRSYGLDVMRFVISRSNRSLSRSHRNT
jgi:hypothetical protein